MKNMLWSWQKTRWFHFSIVVLWTTNCSRLENESMYILSLKMQNEHLMAADIMARYEIRWRFQKFRFNRAILHYWPRCLIGWVLWTDTGVRYFTMTVFLSPLHYIHSEEFTNINLQNEYTFINLILIFIIDLSLNIFLNLFNIIYRYNTRQVSIILKIQKETTKN